MCTISYFTGPGLKWNSDYIIRGWQDFFRAGGRMNENNLDIFLWASTPQGSTMEEGGYIPHTGGRQFPPCPPLATPLLKTGSKPQYNIPNKHTNRKTPNTQTIIKTNKQTHFSKHFLFLMYILYYYVFLWTRCIFKLTANPEVNLHITILGCLRGDFAGQNSPFWLAEHSFVMQMMSPIDFVSLGKNVHVHLSVEIYPHLKHLGILKGRLSTILLLIDYISLSNGYLSDFSVSCSKIPTKYNSIGGSVKLNA